METTKEIVQKSRMRIRNVELYLKGATVTSLTLIQYGLQQDCPSYVKVEKAKLLPLVLFQVQERKTEQVFLTDHLSGEHC